jgi:hypothetical protein
LASKLAAAIEQEKLTVEEAFDAIAQHYGEMSLFDLAAAIARVNMCGDFMTVEKLFERFRSSDSVGAGIASKAKWCSVLGKVCESRVNLADVLASKTAVAAEEQQTKSVSFTDMEGDRSTLKIDDATRFLSWHAQGQCFLERIRVLEFLPSGVIRAPEHSALTARLVDPAPGPARDRLLRDIASMSLSAGGVQLVGFFDFTKEDLDKFGITDLRSTDFIKAGGSYFKPIENKKGVVVQDYFTQNPEDPEPYKVKWENGEVSGWLKPEDIVCVRDKESPWIQECIKNGQISQVVLFQEGSYITGNASCLGEPVSEENLQEEKKNESGPKEPEGDVRSLVCG